MLQRLLGRDVRLVTAGHAIAGEIQRTLAQSGELQKSGQEGTYSFLVTGDVESFERLGTRFLQLPLDGRVGHIELGE
jgi:glutamate racemase